MSKSIRHILFVLLWLVALQLTTSCSTPNNTEQAKEQQVDASEQTTGKESTTEAASEPTDEPDVQDASVEPTVEPTPELPPEPQPEPTQEQPPEPVQETTPEQTLPLPGLGTISGECGVLDDEEWNKKTEPFIFRNSIDFGQTGFDENKLTTGGMKIFKTGNLGGSSVHSEVLAFEVLKRCELSTLLKTEAEITYKQSTGKKTDILVTIDGRKIGVSVTRAFHFPPSNPYTVEEAKTLLNKKLGDIPLSASNASTQDAWERSILYILSYNKQYTDTVIAAYQQLDAKIKDSTILIVTTTDGNDDFVY
ncbi:MAG: hypothetical protein CL920_29295 [Deltaproteobacteria bacterium]|nr:hypothetical protein [Deltaproteobacteria bacterium]